MSDPTPMMRQYLDIKDQHRDKIVFFRLGDFYEMFRDDAVVASRLLGLTLTHRQSEPMCGIPYHSSLSYIRKLLDFGKSIAICEQVSVPGAEKGIVKREVVEILTPGSLVEDGFLPDASPNMTVAIALHADVCTVAAADLSTGVLWATHFSLQGRLEALESELSRFSPREILIAEDCVDRYPFVGDALSRSSRVTVTKLPPWRFDPRGGYRRLVEHFAVSNLYSFGLNERSPEPAALGALLDYWTANAPGRSLKHLRELKVYRAESYLQIDFQAARSLEIVVNSSDEGKDNTLLSVLDRTKTGPGGRLLRNRLQFPLVDPGILAERLDQVEAFVSHPTLLRDVREKLADQLDVERLAARLSLDRASPRDLINLEASVFSSLGLMEVLRLRLESLLPGESWPADSQVRLKTWADRARQVLKRSPSVTINEGGIIEQGYHPELDQLLHLNNHSQEVLQSYLEEEQTSCNLPQLRIRYNKIIGYYFEVSKAKTDALPQHFKRKQSLVGSERFTTPRLQEIEETLLHAQERIFDLERRLFLEFRDHSKEFLSDYQAMVAWTSALDVAASLADVAIAQGYVRPRFTEGNGLHIEAARHPVVELALKQTPFVPNSVSFAEGDSMFLITGPNMAGKSTYLRQTALVVLMGQIGSFVPAEAAHWSIVDRIFCRVGASDHLARGESTFLVEMNETAYILRNATPRSLVIMDEVGRGTSTRDGLSLAWAICEYLLDSVKAKTLFATHFHELTALSHPRLKNFSMAVLEDGEEIVFLRKVIEGAADHSYGLHVASLAGVPPSILARARQILETLPPEGPTGRVPSSALVSSEAAPQLELFEPHDALRAELDALDINHLSPLQALQILDRWKQLHLSHR